MAAAQKRWSRLKEPRDIQVLNGPGVQLDHVADLPRHVAIKTFPAT
jgi:hypothetical protein